VSKSTTSVFFIKVAWQAKRVFITVLLYSPLSKSKLRQTDLWQKEKNSEWIVENREIRGIFWPITRKLPGGQRKLHNKGFHNFHSSKFIDRMVKWNQHHLKTKLYFLTVRNKNSDGKTWAGFLGNAVVCGRIILKCSLKTQDERVWNWFVQLKKGPLPGSCVDGNEQTSAIKARAFYASCRPPSLSTRTIFQIFRYL